MQYFESLEELIKNTKLALLVVDKQDAYANSEFFKKRGKQPAEGTDLVLENIDKLIELFRSKSLPIAWTRMAEGPEVSPAIVAQRMIIHKDTLISAPGLSGYSYFGIKPTLEEVEIDKVHPDAFTVPELAIQLKQESVQTVIIVGGFASRCVFASAMGALHNGFNPVVISDLTVTPQQFAQEVSVTNTIIEDVVGYVTTANVIENCIK